MILTALPSRFGARVATKTFVSAKWFCACNRIWHHCPLHAPRTHRTEHWKIGRRKMPQALAPHEADAKLRKVEPTLACRAIMGPKLTVKFPHPAQGQYIPVASSISTHNCNADAAAAGIAATDPVASTRTATPKEAIFFTKSSSDHYPCGRAFHITRTLPCLLTLVCCNLLLELPLMRLPLLLV